MPLMHHEVGEMQMDIHLVLRTEIMMHLIETAQKKKKALGGSTPVIIQI